VGVCLSRKRAAKLSPQVVGRWGGWSFSVLFFPVVMAREKYEISKEKTAEENEKL